MASGRVSRCSGFWALPRAAPPSRARARRSAPRLPAAIASPFRLRLPEAVLALDHRRVAGPLCRREEQADLGADRLALRLELRPDRLPERIHRRLVPVEHGLHAVALGGGELELLGQVLDEAGAVPVAMAAPVATAVGEAGRGPADQAAEHEARGQEQDGDEALAAHW